MSLLKLYSCEVCPYDQEVSGSGSCNPRVQLTCDFPCSAVPYYYTLEVEGFEGGCCTQWNGTHELSYGCENVVGVTSECCSNHVECVCWSKLLCAYGGECSAVCSIDENCEGISTNTIHSIVLIDGIFVQFYFGCGDFQNFATCVQYLIRGADPNDLTEARNLFDCFGTNLYDFVCSGGNTPNPPFNTFGPNFAGCDSYPDSIQIRPS